jgi:hypothetical protein
MCKHCGLKNLNMKKPPKKGEGVLPVEPFLKTG